MSARALLFTSIIILSVSCSAEEPRQNKASVSASEPEKALTGEPSFTQGYFAVVGVASDDTLNMRTAASAESTLVYKIPYNAKGLLSLEHNGSWVKVSYLHYQGWVHGKYLKSMAAPGFASVIQSELFCLGTEPSWNVKTSGENLSFRFLSDQASFKLNSDIRQSLNDTTVFQGSAVDANHPINTIGFILQVDSSCSDGMSDEEYDYELFVSHSRSQLMSGCCKIKK